MPQRINPDRRIVRQWRRAAGCGEEGEEGCLRNVLLVSVEGCIWPPPSSRLALLSLFKFSLLLLTPLFPAQTHRDEYTEEPHASRRHQIIAAHPEIKKLFGHCPLTKWKVLASVMIQLISIHLLQDADWKTWLFCCYTLSGSINHMMTLAMHELSHNLGAKKVRGGMEGRRDGGRERGREVERGRSDPTCSH